MGVYGSFLSSFPELFERFKVMSREGVNYTIRGIYIPSRGDGIDRKTESFVNWVGDISSNDNLFVSRRFIDKIDIGTYVYHKNDTFKVVKKQDFDRIGSFTIFELQRVQGATLEQDESVNINQGVYQ